MSSTHRPKGNIPAIVLGVIGMLAVAALVAIGWAEVSRLRQSVAILQRDMAVLEEANSLRAGMSPVSPLLLDYHLEVPGRGEVFPAMAATGAPEYWPLAVLRVTNTADLPVALTVSAEIPDWSRRVEQSLVVGPRSERVIQIQPDLLARAFENNEIRRAHLDVKTLTPEGAVLYAESRPVLVHGGSEIYWGRKFVNAQVAARWVTPHDAEVLGLVGSARRQIAGGRMTGYAGQTSESDIARHVRDQARAIYQAMQTSEIGYVNGLFVMGDYFEEAQRVRLPRETLKHRSANCMDVAVAFASAIENLDMQPLLVILPGHAVAAVRLGPNSEDLLHLDLTLLPDGSFDAAVREANEWIRKTPREKIIVVDVSVARVLGIYPLVVDNVAIARAGADSVAGRLPG